MEKFYSTKRYGNDAGLSCCFRQWRSTHSHCSQLHGYAIGVKVVFGCEALDERNWVHDFGGLKNFKEWLKEMFDHTVLVAKDDPELETFKSLSRNVIPGNMTLIKLKIVDNVGCEAFAKMAYNTLEMILAEQRVAGTLLNKTVYIESVEVFEHEGNSAIYKYPYKDKLNKNDN